MLDRFLPFALLVAAGLLLQPDPILGQTVQPKPTVKAPATSRQGGRPKPQPSSTPTAARDRATVTAPAGQRAPAVVTTPVTRQLGNGRSQVGGKVRDRLADTPLSPRGRGVAECATQLTLGYGSMTAGTVTSLDYVKRDPSRENVVAVINGEPVTLPRLGSETQSSPIMPKIQRLYFSYPKVLISPEPNVMRNGWLSKESLTLSEGEIIKDNGDGTAEVRLPPAPDAIFAQTVELTVVTDRCTIKARSR